MESQPLILQGQKLEAELSYTKLSELVEATTTLKVGGMCLKPFLNVRLKKKKTARSVEPGRTPCTHRSAVSRLDLKENERPAKKIIGKISGLTRVSGLQLQTRLLRPLRPPWFFFSFCRVAALRWQPITSVEVKFVARQVEASVVIRATKLKFVAESRTRVYFSQHVASTCNIVFCCETSWPRRW